jgi:DNA-binding NarL/FixJ family response regulator
MEKIKIVLVDDHKIIMEGISSLLMNEESIEVVGQALNSDELFHLLDNQSVHIVILDIFLPKPVGIDILKSIIKLYSKVKVILLSGNDEEVLISSAFQAGASGYLTKSVEKDELIEAIQAVNGGDHYISKALESYLDGKLIKRIRFSNKIISSGISGLTSRENEIIRFLAEGLSYKEVAGQMNISTRTVEVHRNNILEKLELKNTIELVKYAIKKKMIDL